MIQSLQRIARKNPELDFARFVIEAENELNPERSNDPDYNFSFVEAVAGWVAPRPINQRASDIRVYIDEFGRPDLYAKRFCGQNKLRWNEDPATYPLFIYRIEHDAEEIYPATKRRGEKRIDVVYDYLQTMQGEDEVKQVDTHMANTVQGIEERRAAIQGALDIQEVERVRERVLQENAEKRKRRREGRR
jgi:hypothetical protein